MEGFHPGLILCPTDFSESASLALRYADEFARSSKSDLFVIYADSLIPPPYFTSDQVGELVESRKRARETADRHLQRYVRDVLGDGTQVETAIVEGSPVSSILRAADQRNAGLIVMGAHGVSGFNRLMLGSVAERVLRETDRPVLSVRAREGSASPAIRRILCPVNFSDVAFAAFGYAVDLSQTFDAELIALHVVEPGGDDVPKEEFSERLCGWMSAELRLSCTLTHLVRRGNAAEQIIEAASSDSCDLIILGGQHKRFFDATVIGSTTVRVTRHAPCPVLTIVRIEAA